MGEHRATHDVFQHAIERRNLLSAEAAARELGWLSLADALAFLLLLSEKDPARFDPPAARWHARFVLEARRLGLPNSQLLLGAVAGLRYQTPTTALDAIRGLADQHYQVGCEIFHGDEGVLDCVDKVRELAADYQLREVMYDPWRFGQAAQELQAERIVVTQFPQTTRA